MKNSYARFVKGILDETWSDREVIVESTYNRPSVVSKWDYRMDSGAIVQLKGTILSPRWAGMLPGDGKVEKFFVYHIAPITIWIGKKYRAFYLRARQWYIHVHHTWMHKHRGIFYENYY